MIREQRSEIRGPDQLCTVQFARRRGLVVGEGGSGVGLKPRGLV
jgi:hypothetical protein